MGRTKGSRPIPEIRGRFCGKKTADASLELKNGEESKRKGKENSRESKRKGRSRGDKKNEKTGWVRQAVGEKRTRKESVNWHHRRVKSWERDGKRPLPLWKGGKKFPILKWVEVPAHSERL